MGMNTTHAEMAAEFLHTHFGSLREAKISLARRPDAAEMRGSPSTEDDVARLSFALILIESETRNDTVIGHPEIKCATCKGMNNVAARALSEGKSE